MAKAKAALDHKLTPFEGRDVARATMKIMKAGDGLSDAMSLDPMELHHGEEVYCVIKGTVAKVNFPPISGADGLLSREHVIHAEEIAIVAPDEVEALLDRERERILKLKEEAAGVQRLPDPNADPLNVFGGRSESTPPVQPNGSGG